ncbi:hypothetical protein [Neobacillus massiliamazoniensis]|uniref:Helix-turn-helix domain-containing protein n=1 Tax=Neobacillus massiliamazoniensis TaxID=1499688 RepID=A0A0U1NZH4_9BACI|nr:hypothetical protein [Neobacillus massiliamazoniensis]CRK83430.1 hypothetical protein BN000_03398 [Neobacillus massiliamazoniensis]
MIKANKNVLKAKGFIPYWLISQKLAIHEVTLIRWMRTEMSEEKKLRVLAAIDEVKREKEREEED